MRYFLAILLGLANLPTASALCFWHDVQCMAGIVLPGYDPDPESEREWTSYSGRTYGIGNKIITRVRFDQEAIDLLRGGNYGAEFGLEIEISLSGDNKDITLDRVESTFPANAKPGRDTEASDSLTNGNNTVHAVHVLDPSVLEAETDYYVFFVFAKDLPQDGVKVVSNLQLTLDIDFTRNFIYEMVPWLDQFQYFALETDSHRQFTARPASNEGVCWSVKTTSQVCYSQEGTCSASSGQGGIGFSRMASALFGISDAYAGSCSTPNGGGSVPILGQGNRVLPGDAGAYDPVKTNLKIDFDILDVDGNELYAGKDTLGPMPVKLRVQVVAEHDDAGNWAKAGREKISIDYFARYDGGDWAKVGSGEMTIGKLDEGRMIQETLVYGIPNVATTRVEFKASIDTDHEIDESDEGDNTSRVESYAYDVNAITLYRPDMTMAGLSLTGGRGQLTQGDRFGLQAWPKNVGGRKAAASRMAYYLQAPGGGLNYVMDDGVDELSPGQDSYELTRNEPFTANVGGWWHAYAFADYQGNVTESNEGNNGLDYWFYVVPAMPDLVVEALWLREGGSFKKDTRVHPYCVVRNIGNGTAGPSRLAYFIDENRFRDGDDVDSLCPGCNATEHVINDNIKLGDTGNRTYRCCVDAWGSVAESNEDNNCATIGFTVKKK